MLTDDEQVGQLRDVAPARRRTRAAIAHIGGPPIVHAKRRERGWREALKARGLKAPEEWIVRGGFMESGRLPRDEAAADGAAAHRRASSPRTTRPAIGAMKAIWEAGLRVPDDIAIVGVGDIALGDLLRVPLTTVGWSRRDQGRRAAELLLNGLDLKSDPPQRIVIPPRLDGARILRGGAMTLASVTSLSLAVALRIADCGLQDSIAD